MWKCSFRPTCVRAPLMFCRSVCACRTQESVTRAVVFMGRAWLICHREQLSPRSSRAGVKPDTNKVKSVLNCKEMNWSQCMFYSQSLRSDIFMVDCWSWFLTDSVQTQTFLCYILSRASCWHLKENWKCKTQLGYFLFQQFKSLRAWVKLKLPLTWEASRWPWGG